MFCFGLQGFNAMWTYRQIPVFQRNVLFPFPGLNMETVFLLNIGIYVKVHMALQCRRPPFSSAPLREPEVSHAVY
jgi:hypothetical protein